MFVLRPAKLFLIAPQNPRNQAGLHCLGDGDLDRLTIDDPGSQLTRGRGGGVFHRTLEVPLSKEEDSLKKKKRSKHSGEQAVDS